MRIDIITIFPEYFGPLRVSLLGKAAERGIIEFVVHDLRAWAHDIHRTVDDTPFGGGPGMVMMPGPWGEALDAVASGAPGTRLVVPTPAGIPFRQEMAAGYARQAPSRFRRAAGMRGSTPGSSRTPGPGCPSTRSASATTCSRAGNRPSWS